MAESQGYNGWTNYETWAVALWIHNDEAEYETTRAMARAYADRTAENEYADWLEAFVEETMPDLGASLWADLLNASFSEVDWYEIAKNYIEEVQE